MCARRSNIWPRCATGRGRMEVKPMAEIAAPFPLPLIDGNKSLSDVTHDVCAPLERPATRAWWAAFSAAVLLLIIGVVSVGYQVATGIGTWGLNRTVGWGFDITNFVFW